MFFKALTVFRLDAEWLAALPPLATQLAEHPLHEIPAMALESRGWQPQVTALEDAEQFTLLRDYRAVPAGAVRRLAERRINELEAQQGYALGRQARRQITEDTAARLTPGTPVQRTQIHAVLDRRAGLLLIDTASKARADEFTQALRSALGSLPAQPLAARSPMAAQMTRWLAASAAPAPLALADDCQLVSVDEHKASVRYAHHDLTNDGVIEHLRAGKLASHLALTWRERLAFIVDTRLSLRRLRFTDEVAIAENRERGDAEQTAQADLALMIGTLRQFLSEFTIVTDAQPA